jgi:formiminoglutamate deiminase
VDSFAKLFESCKRVISNIPDAILGVAPHSLRAATPAELMEIASLAGHAPIHIHAAEQTKEVDDCVAWSGARPVEWLLHHTNVGEFWTLIHATHMTEMEASALAKSGAVAGICAITEANLGDGVFRAQEFIAAGGWYGIGTDSNVRIDPAEELRSVEYAQRLTRRARNLWTSTAYASTGRALFDGALAGGARSLGEVASGIRINASADLVSFDPEDPALAGRSGDAILDSWIFAGARIDSVWRRGQKRVSRGRHVARGNIEADYRRVLHQLLSDS